MAYLAQESFNIPPGFAVEEIKGQLYYDDLEEDDELWLIRMPCDVELSTLDRRKIFLSDDVGGTSIKNFETESGKSLECFAETCEISNTSVVLPKRQDGQLHAVKKVLKGAILISEGLCLNNEIEIKSEKEDVHLDDDLSFVTEECNTEKRTKRKKKAHSDLNTKELLEKHENVDERSEDSNISICKKKKRKKSHSDVNANELLEKYENVDKHSEDSNNSICKKKKKKRKSHSDLNENELEIRYENSNEHSEGSNNSTCKKRKKSKKNKHMHNDFNFDDLDYETEAAESFNSPKPKKNSSPHKKSSERLKIKDEPMSVDFDNGFPTCNSQR